MQLCAHGPRANRRLDHVSADWRGERGRGRDGWWRSWASARSGWAGRPGFRRSGRCSRRPTGSWSRPGSSTCGAMTPRTWRPNTRSWRRSSPTGCWSASASAIRRPRASTPRRSPRCAHSSTAWTRPTRRCRATVAVWRRSDRRCSSSARRARAEPTRTSSGSRIPGRHARSWVTDALLAPELACVVDGDAESARAKARRYAELYLGLRNYTSNLLRHGFNEDDIAEGGSDRLIDAVIPHGGAERDRSRGARAPRRRRRPRVPAAGRRARDPAGRVDRARGSARQLRLIACNV